LSPLGLISSSVFSLITLPLIYGVSGFLGALVFTPLVNLVLKIIGGLEVDIDMQANSV
jgi:hypothetical protein